MEKMENNTASKTKRPNKLWLVPLILVILFVSFWLIPNIVFWLKYGGMPIAAQTAGFAPDCIWSGTAVAWIDENQNGQFEASEQPLQNVVFHVSDGDSSISNWKGESTLSVWLPGCPQANFEIYPEIPNGYKLTTSASISADVRDLNMIFEFGFITLEGVPTETARPSSPTCTSYQIGIANQYDVSDIAIAADGSVWAATFGNGVVHYISEKDEWIRYTAKDGLIGDKVYSITTLNNGDIWFAARGGASVWNGSNWSSYTVGDGLIGGEVFKVAQGYDDSIWFATESGVSHFVSSTGTWTNYTTSDGLADNFIAYVIATPDNSIWLSIPSEGLARLILPASDNEVEQWITYSKYSEGEKYIPVNYVDEIQIAPDGTYWFAGSGGLIQYDPTSKEWKFDESTSNIGGNVNSFTFEQDGSIWIASGTKSPEIYHLNNQNIWEIYDSRDGIPTINKGNDNEDRAEGIVLDLNNNVWIATRETATRCVFPGK